MAATHRRAAESRRARPYAAVPPVLAGTDIDSSIKNPYNAIEPYVRYGFELAQYAVGFIPYVGWLAPQIIIFYNLGERIARSFTFNTADFLVGTISFGQSLSNFTVDTINSFIYFANDELAFFLPPLPPLPPLPGGSIIAPHLRQTLGEVPDATEDSAAPQTRGITNRQNSGTGTTGAAGTTGAPGAGSTD